MGTVVSLGAWGAGLQSKDIPKPVDQRVRLQLLHVATLIAEAPDQGCWNGFEKLASRRGSARLKGGKTSSPAASARIHASRAAWSDRLDHLLGGPAGVGGVCAALALAKGCTLDEVLSAVVVGNEIGGRVGASVLLGPNHGLGAGWVHTTAAAAAAGKMMGLDASKMGHAIALALVSGSAIPRSVIVGEGRSAAVGGFVAAGVDAARAAQAGVEGPLDILDAAGGLLENSCWLPLRHAFSGLGEAWLTQTVSFPRWPGPAAWHSAFDCVDEVLQRHVKAADKRLRADQLTGLHVHISAPGVALDRWMGRYGIRTSAGLGHSLRHAIGALVVEHQLGSDELMPTNWSERLERYGDVASRVEVTHDLDFTLGFMGAVVQTASPLIGGVTEAEWRGILGKLENPQEGWPGLGLKNLRSVMKHRPDRWLRSVRYAAGNLADAQLADWQLHLGARIELRTTRGGHWPDQRSIAHGSPGTAWNQVVGDVVGRFAGEDPARDQFARQLMESAVEEAASSTVERLLY